MLAPDGELTSDRLVVLLLVDCKPSRSNQRNMTLKSGLTENAPYKCADSVRGLIEIFFQTLLMTMALLPQCVIAMR